MAVKKKVSEVVGILLPGGKATPAPPVATALGPRGVNLMEFVKEFNALTAKNVGVPIPAVVTIYVDRSFSVVVKEPPVSYLIRKALGVEKGSSSALQTKIGKITKAQAEEIAKIKMAELNTNDLAAAVRTVAGTARSMGVDVVGI